MASLAKQGSSENISPGTLPYPTDNAACAPDDLLAPAAARAGLEPTALVTWLRTEASAADIERVLTPSSKSEANALRVAFLTNMLWAPLASPRAAPQTSPAAAPIAAPQGCEAQPHSLQAWLRRLPFAEALPCGWRMPLLRALATFHVFARAGKVSRPLDRMAAVADAVRAACLTERRCWPLTPDEVHVYTRLLRLAGDGFRYAAFLAHTFALSTDCVSRAALGMALAPLRQDAHQWLSAAQDCVFELVAAPASQLEDHEVLSDRAEWLLLARAAPGRHILAASAGVHVGGSSSVSVSVDDMPALLLPPPTSTALPVAGSQVAGIPVRGVGCVDDTVRAWTAGFWQQPPTSVASLPAQLHMMAALNGQNDDDAPGTPDTLPASCAAQHAPAEFSAALRRMAAAASACARPLLDRGVRFWVHHGAAQYAAPDDVPDPAAAADAAASAAAVSSSTVGIKRNRCGSVAIEASSSRVVKKPRQIRGLLRTDIATQAYVNPMEEDFEMGDEGENNEGEEAAEETSA